MTHCVNCNRDVDVDKVCDLCGGPHLVFAGSSPKGTGWVIAACACAPKLLDKDATGDDDKAQ